MTRSIFEGGGGGRRFPPMLRNERKKPSNQHRLHADPNPSTPKLQNPHLLDKVVDDNLPDGRSR